jgi:hypothetical protein
MVASDHSEPKWGGDMPSYMKSRIFLFLFAALIGAGPAWGQAVEFAFDFNTPAADSPKYSGQPPIDVDAGLGWSFGYFGRGAFAEGGPFRWGALIGRKSMKVSPQGGYPGYSYSAVRLQGRGDARLWSGRTFSLTGGLGAGVTFFSDNIPCNELFCVLPSSAVEITPNLRLSGRISDVFSVFFDVRGSVYLSDQTATYPHESGVILALGVEISAYSPEVPTQEVGGDF